MNQWIFTINIYWDKSKSVFIIVHLRFLLLLIIRSMYLKESYTHFPYNYTAESFNIDRKCIDCSYPMIVFIKFLKRLQLLTLIR